jgi:imidazolonepropionase-like amidohydrolase
MALEATTGKGRMAIVGGRVLPIEGTPFEAGAILIEDGRITALGPDIPVPDGAERIDAAGKVILPGLVDAHVHVGVHEEAEGWAEQDTNEMTNPVTPQIHALDAVNPDDLGFQDAVSGGCSPSTSTPDRATRSAARRWRCTGRTVDEMVLRAPSGLKSALGENPKRVYGECKEYPSTRLGTAAVIRESCGGARWPTPRSWRPPAWRSASSPTTRWCRSNCSTCRPRRRSRRGWTRRPPCAPSP